MSEVEFTLPTAQYANVKVRATPEELGLHGVDNAYELGVAAAVYLNLFTQGYNVGGAMDVVAPSGPLKAPQGAEQSEVDRVIDETPKAAQILADGLGGVTEVEEEGAAPAAPWDAKVEAKPKPWQSDGW